MKRHKMVRWWLGFATLLFAGAVSAGEDQGSRDSGCNDFGWMFAANWHKTFICAELHPEMTNVLAEKRARLAAAYPKLVDAFTSAPWADEAKSIAKVRIYEKMDDDPRFNKTICEMTGTFLVLPIDRADWVEAMACWK